MSRRRLFSAALAPVVALVAPAPSDIVPSVARVPGKEYTDVIDLNHVPSPHASQPTQIGHFDGQGGAPSGLLLSAYGSFAVDYQVDAQSQVRDTLFQEVRDNRVPLIVSAQFDQMLGNDTALAAERTGGGVQSFATRSQVVNHGHPGGTLRDIDSVDLWGPENAPHASFYSFQGDPNGTSIYTLQLLAPGFLNPYVSTGDIAGASATWSWFP